MDQAHSVAPHLECVVDSLAAQSHKSIGIPQDVYLAVCLGAHLAAGPAAGPATGPAAGPTTAVSTTVVNCGASCSTIKFDP